MSHFKFEQKFALYFISESSPATKCNLHIIRKEQPVKTAIEGLTSSAREQPVKTTTERLRLSPLKTRHLKIGKSTKLFVCNKCSAGNKFFYSHTSLLMHQKQKHPLLCQHCGTICPTIAKLRDHISSNHSEGSSCGICSKTFKSVKNLKRHQIIHCVDRKSYCAQCKKAFQNEAAFRVHCEISHKQGQFHCSICQKRFNKNSDKDRHERLIHSESMSRCPICHKKIRTTVNAHMSQEHPTTLKLINDI